MARDVRVLAEGFSLLEGPRWHEGRLFASDFFTHRVLSFAPDGSCTTVAEVEGQPSGLGWDLEGRLLISSMTDRRLLRLDDGRLTQVADLRDVTDGHLNDMVVDAQGRAYIGNFGDGANLARTSLVRVDPDGSAARTGGDVFCPNGSCITPDGRTFLLAESMTCRISAFDIGADGWLRNRRDWATFAEPLAPMDVVQAAMALPMIPDGMCLDAEGCVWLACAKTGGAYRVREGGEILETIETGEQTVFATMLGGEDGKTLYLCCAAPILQGGHETVHEATLRACRVDVPAAGRP